MSEVKSEASVPVAELMKATLFLGTKSVRAYPMSRQQYVDYRGWELPKDENGDDPVYLVEYKPNPLNKPNHPDHEGYITMSPKNVFDDAYRANGKLRFSDCIIALNAGRFVKVPEWKGYWFKEAGMVKVMTAEGKVLETPHFQQYMFREDWSILPDSYTFKKS